MDLRLLGLRPPPSGMFSNVNEVVQHVHLAREENYKFVIDWSRSCYRSDARDEDPWSYYFEPVWPDLERPVDPLRRLPTGPVVACTRDNIITPRLVDGQCNPLLLPTNRAYAGEIIEQHIRLNPETGRKVNRFLEANLSSEYIGLHIRGPGRLHGGSGELRRAYGEEGNVPFFVYYEEVDKALQQMPSAKIFACSDSSMVIENVLERYGDRVVTYDATRSAFGEMHAEHHENAGVTFDNYELGLDILIESYALAGSQYFIHGNTNVANFVLCKSPELAHKYVPA